MSMTLVQGPASYAHWSDTKKIHIKGQIVLSGNYVTGGDTLSFAVNNPTIKTGAIGPSHVDITGVTPYQLNYYPNPVNPNLTNGLIKIFRLSTGVELAAGPYPADLLADPFLRIYCIFKKYVDLG